MAFLFWGSISAWADIKSQIPLSSRTIYAWNRVSQNMSSTNGLMEITIKHACDWFEWIRVCNRMLKLLTSNIGIKMNDSRRNNIRVFSWLCSSSIRPSLAVSGSCSRTAICWSNGWKIWKNNWKSFPNLIQISASGWPLNRSAASQSVSYKGHWRSDRGF